MVARGNIYVIDIIISFKKWAGDHVYKRSPISFPVVARGKARIRVQISAAHSDQVESEQEFNLDFFDQEIDSFALFDQEIDADFDFFDQEIDAAVAAFVKVGRQLGVVS